MRDRWDALSREEAREWALRYLRRELEEGVTPERILRSEGYRGGPDEPGIHFDKGLIVIAGTWPEGRWRISSARELGGHHFQAAELLRDIQSGQLSLFGGAPCAAS